MYAELFDTDNGWELIKWRTEDDARAEAEDGQSRAIARYPACDQCMFLIGPMYEIKDVGHGEIKVVYVDADGESDGLVWLICQECFDVFHNGLQGPGYVLAHLWETN